MAAPRENTLSLENPDFVDIWIRAFAVKARTQKLREKESDREMYTDTANTDSTE